MVEDEKMYAEVLKIILEVMHSKYGVFGYIDEAENLVCASFSEDIWNKCQVNDKTNIFSRKAWTGIWGDALISKKTLFSNKKRKVPKGHVPINKAMAVPIVHRNKTIGLLLVANKAENYTRKNSRRLKTIANFIAPILDARLQRDRQQKKCKQAETLFYKLMETASQAGEGILLVSYKENHPQVILANEAAYKITGYSKETLFKNIDLEKYVAAESLPLAVELYKKSKTGLQEPLSIEIAILHKNGHKVYLEIKSAVTTYENQSCSMIFMRDVSEKKKLQKEVSQKTRGVCLFKDIAQIINKTHNQDDMLHEILCEVKEFMGLNQIGIYSLDSQKNKLYLKKEIGLNNDVINYIREIDLKDNPLSASVVENKKTMTAVLTETKK